MGRRMGDLKDEVLLVEGGHGDDVVGVLAGVVLLLRHLPRREAEGRV